jgi:hypothetical protein
MNDIQQLTPNKDFTYIHPLRTPEGYVMAQPIIEVVSGVYKGLKMLVTSCAYSYSTTKKKKIKNGNLFYDYKLMSFCKNGKYESGKITLNSEDQYYMHSLVYSYMADINKRELFKDPSKPSIYYNS